LQKKEPAGAGSGEAAGAKKGGKKGAGEPAGAGSSGAATATATAGAGSSVEEPPEECKIFYGEDVTDEQCTECEDSCVSEAEQAGSDAWMECASNPASGEVCMMEAEKAGFNRFFSCADACFGATNLVKQACDEHFPEATFMKCCECGGECSDCGFDGTCDCIKECMKPKPKKKDSELLQVSEKAIGSGPSYKAWHQKLVKKLVKAAEVKKQSSDVTDLMQTGKHLK